MKRLLTILCLMLLAVFPVLGQMRRKTTARLSKPSVVRMNSMHSWQCIPDPLVLIVTVQPNAEYTLNKIKIRDAAALSQWLHQTLDGRPADRKEIWVLAAGTIPYAEVVKTIDLITEANGGPIMLNLGADKKGAHCWAGTSVQAVQTYLAKVYAARGESENDLPVALNARDDSELLVSVSENQFAMSGKPLTASELHSLVRMKVRVYRMLPELFNEPGLRLAMAANTPFSEVVRAMRVMKIRHIGLAVRGAQ